MKFFSNACGNKISVVFTTFECVNCVLFVMSAHFWGSYMWRKCRYRKCDCRRWSGSQWDTRERYDNVLKRIIHYKKREITGGKKWYIWKYAENTYDLKVMRAVDVTTINYSESWDETGALLYFSDLQIPVHVRPFIRRLPFRQWNFWNCAKTFVNASNFPLIYHFIQTK